MDNDNLLIAMIEQCRSTIQEHEELGLDQPDALRSKHLVWMCDRLVENVNIWRYSKINRWIGFVQCALIANRMIDLDEAKRMFDHAKNAFAEPDQDLIDHLALDDSYEFDIGGEG